MISHVSSVIGYHISAIDNQDTTIYKFFKN